MDETMRRVLITLLLLDEMSVMKQVQRQNLPNRSDLVSASAKTLRSCGFLLITLVTA